MTEQKVFIISRCAWTLHNFRRALIHELQRIGFDVTALGAKGDGYENHLKDVSIRFRHVPVSLRGLDPLMDIWLFLRLVFLIAITRPKVVHAFTIKPVIYGTVAAWMAGVPVRVVTITGLGHAFTSGSGLLRRIVESLYRFALARADIVFFQNRDDRDLFLERRLVSPSRVRLVAGSGVDLSRFEVKPLPYLSGDRPKFVMVARLLREKGIAEYIDAADRVKRSFPNVELDLVGGLDARNPSGFTEEEFRNLNSRGSVNWVGEVEDVRPYIAAADVVVLPSYREGVPRSLLEGAAMGRALIATDAVGCREVVKDGLTGYSVPVANSTALAQAMCRLVENPDMISQFGDAARMHVEEYFDERTVIGQTIRAYEELISRKVANA